MSASGATDELSLKQRLADAEATIVRLTEAFGGLDLSLAVEFSLTPAESLALGCMMRHDVVSRTQLATLIGAASARERAPKANGMHVLVYRLRDKLEARGFKIDTLTGLGWALRPSSRKRLSAMLDAKVRRVGS